MEGTLRSVNPLAYLVNTLPEFNPEVVKAHRNKDHDKIKQLVAMGRMDMDIFICVNKSWHGFVLCIPAGSDEHDLFSDVLTSPFDVPPQLLCWLFELCYENERQRMYQIRRECKMFSDIEGRVHRSYRIGKFTGTSLHALEFAALRAAPHRYSVLLDDCVEFAKEFCVQALAYCSNWRELEAQVHDNIAKASASGFSVEKLSRNVRSSGWLGNTFLGGTDVSSWMSGQGNPVITILALVLLIVAVNAVVTVFLIKALT